MIVFYDLQSCLSDVFHLSNAFGYKTDNPGTIEGLELLGTAKST